jgi:hypothetical protein
LKWTKGALKWTLVSICIGITPQKKKPQMPFEKEYLFAVSIFKADN